MAQNRNRFMDMENGPMDAGGWGREWDGLGVWG